jgi:hypothetical protein
MDGSLPGIYRRHQWYFPLYALAFCPLDLRRAGYDLVVSNKAVLSRRSDWQHPHLCYCLAPTRYVWEFDAYAAREQLPAALKLLLRPVVNTCAVGLSRSAAIHVALYRHLRESRRVSTSITGATRRSSTPRWTSSVPP